MTVCFLNCFRILLLLHIFYSISNSQSKEELGDWFYKQGDYFRAISVYRELEFYSKNIDSIYIFKFKIAKSYFFSGYYRNSLNELIPLLDNPPEERIKTNILNFVSLNYLKLSLPNQALYYASKITNSDSIRTLFLLGLIHLNLDDYYTSKDYFNKVHKEQSFSTFGISAKENIDMINDFNSKKYKSPITAMLLSALLPGTGQLYSGFYFDALQSFAFVSIFSYISYLTYKYDQSNKKCFTNFAISFSLASIFHISNILGAQRSAVYYNHKRKTEFLESINNKSILLFR